MPLSRCVLALCAASALAPAQTTEPAAVPNAADGYRAAAAALAACADLGDTILVLPPADGPQAERDRAWITVLEKTDPALGLFADAARTSKCVFAASATPPLTEFDDLLAPLYQLGELTRERGHRNAAAGRLDAALADMQTLLLCSQHLAATPTASACVVAPLYETWGAELAQSISRATTLDGDLAGQLRETLAGHRERRRPAAAASPMLKAEGRRMVDTVLREARAEEGARGDVVRAFHSDIRARVLMVLDDVYEPLLRADQAPETETRDTLRTAIAKAKKRSKEAAALVKSGDHLEAIDALAHLFALLLIGNTEAIAANHATARRALDAAIEAAARTPRL